MSTPAKLRLISDLKRFYNRKIFLIIALIIINIYNIGQIIIHQILLYRLFGGIINIIGGYDYESAVLFFLNTYFDKIGFKFIINFCILILILFPLCLYKNKQKFYKFSNICFIIFLYISLVILIQFPFYLLCYKDRNINIIDVGKGFTKDLYFFQSFGLFFFCFSGHNGLIYGINEFNNLKETKEKNRKKLFLYPIILNVAIYIITSIIGYVTSPNDNIYLIIERKRL